MVGNIETWEQTQTHCRDLRNPTNAKSMYVLLVIIYLNITFDLYLKLERC